MISLKYFFITLLFVFNFQFPKDKEFFVFDRISKEPIELANVFYLNFNEGSVSNIDGKVKIHVRDDSLLISCVGYEIKKLTKKELLSIDTLYLHPSIIKLKEIGVNSLDLKQRLQAIVKRYFKLYTAQSRLIDCTFKERVAKNGNIVRLFQTQLKWWSKNYLYKKYNENNIKKKNQFSLSQIEYAKTLSDSIVYGHAFINNQSLIKILHLNFQLGLLTQKTNKIFVSSVEYQKKHMKITFDAPVIVNKDTIYHHKNSSMFFDKETGAITHLNLQMLYNSRKKHKFSEKYKMKYATKTKRHLVDIYFKQLKNKKWALNYFRSTLYAEIEMNSETDNSEIDAYTITHKLFVTKTSKSGKINNSPLIDINKPFYENIPNNVSNINSILLSRKELDFINQE